MQRALLVIVAILFSSQLALAQFTQQGPKLVGTGAVGSANQGLFVALSADGNTAIVGGDSDNSGVGAVWVFTRSNGVWTQQGNKLVGTGAVGSANQGRPVALSADGNTAIVGGESDNSGVGAVWVFTRSNGVWTQQGDKLVGTGAVGAARQGWSVALSGDGNTATVGGSFDNSFTGAVWVFTRSNGVWTQQGNKLVGTGAVGAARQGQSVALSGNGNTAIVGGPFDNSFTGAVWVFTRSNGVWTQQGNKLVGTGAVGAAFQGQSVALSGDANTAIVGGVGDNSNAGAVWVFTRSNGVWTQQGNKLIGTGAVGSANQGQSVALSGDGNTATVGGPVVNAKAGAAWVFTRSNGVWTQQGNKLVGTGAVGAAFQGQSVALSGDGNTAIVGGLGDNAGAGAVWVFVLGRARYPLRHRCIGAARNIAPAGILRRLRHGYYSIVISSPLFPPFHIDDSTIKFRGPWVKTELIRNLKRVGAIRFYVAYTRGPRCFHRKNFAILAAEGELQLNAGRLRARVEEFANDFDYAIRVRCPI